MSVRHDLIALGETMLSLIGVDGSLASSSSFYATHGGAESNACVGFARLGLRCAWVGRLGTDAFGDRIADALVREGIDLRWVTRDEDHLTGVMVRDTLGGVRYARAGSAASFTCADDLDGVPVEESRAVLVSGVTALIGEDPGRAALALLEAARGVRVVDPNLRQGLWGSDRSRELVLPLIERADIVLTGEGELRAILGVDESVMAAEGLARRCRDLGPREVVVKRGSAGAGALDAEGVWHGSAPEPAPDVDPVGAGDAFNAGYLAARLSGGSPADALIQGARCGAAVASTVGDTEGFPFIA